MRKIVAAARGSPLSRAQVEEVASLLKRVRSPADLSPLYVDSQGDLDKKTSLRTLGKSDFFTKEVDALVLSRHADIAIHSAKDLPEKVPEGLKILAITRGLTPKDALVFREFDFLDTLKEGALIATSSERREEVVRSLRNDLQFQDLRGTIGERLHLLDEKKADGVVVAECALKRLGLNHLNRIMLPGETCPMQGQLAIVAREDDEESDTLFALLDARRMKRMLYLGDDFPTYAFQDRALTLKPLIEITPSIKARGLEDWNKISHLVLTSKNSVRALLQLLRRRHISPATIQEKTVIAIGEATKEALFPFFSSLLLAEESTQEGVIETLLPLAEEIDLLYYPHGDLARGTLKKALVKENIPHIDEIIYATSIVKTPQAIDFECFDEIAFSSPSTVDAFFHHFHKIPDHLTPIAIGPVTEKALFDKVPKSAILRI